MKANPSGIAGEPPYGQFDTVVAQTEELLKSVETAGRSKAGPLKANVKQALAAAGASLDDVVAVTAYLTNVDDWGKFNDIYKAIFRPPYPTRTAIGADLRGILVEISAIAYVRSAKV